MAQQSLRSASFTNINELLLSLSEAGFTPKMATRLMSAPEDVVYRWVELLEPLLVEAESRPPGIPEPPPLTVDSPIEYLDLLGREVRLLMRHGIFTVSALLEICPANPTKSPIVGLGKKFWTLTIDKLESAGFTIPAKQRKSRPSNN